MLLTPTESIMNQRDMANLEFLRSLSPQGLLNWFEQASDDDIVYATELLTAWEDQLAAQEFEEFGSDFTMISTQIH